MSYIYLASPYHHDDPQVRFARYLEAERATAWLLNRGQFTFSPIVHCYHMANRYNLPHDVEFWWEYNKAMMIPSDDFYYLKIDGWEESKGLKRELEWMSAHHRPVVMMEPQDHTYLVI